MANTNKPSTIREKLTRAAADRLPDPEAATEILGEATAELVPVRPTTRATLQTAGEAAVKLARIVEQGQWAATYTADATHRAALIDLLTKADDFAADRELVPADLIGQLRSELEGWAKDRGLDR
jgi:hypothetical protein